MQAKESLGRSRLTFSRLSSLPFISRASVSRSPSPDAYDVEELLQVRKMHSFTRRMKAWNEDRNPDSGVVLPSYMRQTCASLIKRPRPPGSARSSTATPRRSTATPGRSRRTTSMDRDAKSRTRTERNVPQRNVHSSLGHSRGMSGVMLGYEPNDKLGFLLEEMPAGFEWFYSPATSESGGSVIMEPIEQKKPTKRVPNKNGGGRSGNVKTVKSVQVRRSQSRSGGSEIMAESSSRAPSQRPNRSPAVFSDRKSDSANNTSPGKLEDLDIIAANIEVLEAPLAHRRKKHPLERSPQPKATLPLKEMDTAGNKSGRNTPATSSRSVPDESHFLTEQAGGLQSSKSAPTHPEVAHNEQGTRIMLDSKKENENQERQSVQLENCSVALDLEGQSTNPLDSGFDAIEEKVELETPDENWRSPTFTTGGVDDLFDIQQDIHPPRTRTRDSLEETSDTMSNGSQPSRPKDSERVIEDTAETLQPKRSFSSNKKKEECPSTSEDPTKKKLKLKRPKFLKNIRTRLSLADRLKCFSFKACFCGADVSPGPEVDDDHSIDSF